MWTPTHAQVTVHRARNLVPKGKGGTNDAYVTIQLGKEKYQTTVKERSENPEWHEECDMRIGNAKEVHLNVFHRSFLGLDDFLGHVSLPLEQFQIYDRPRSIWYAMKGRPGKKGDTKYRGEIECKITFVVQSNKNNENPEVLRRAGSIKNLANTVSEKLKLPVRSSSFKEKEEASKKKKAFIEPLVRSPSDKLSLPPNSSPGFIAPDKAETVAPFGLTEQEIMERQLQEKDGYTEMSIDVPPLKRNLAPLEMARERPRESLTSKLDQKDTTPPAFSTVSFPSIRPRRHARMNSETRHHTPADKTQPETDGGDPPPSHEGHATPERSPTTPRHIGTIKECPEPERDSGLTPLQNQNKQLSFSEADLNKRWRSSDVNRRVCDDEADGLIKYKQPVYKDSIFPTKPAPVSKAVVPPTVNEAPLLRRATSEADAKFVQKGKPDDVKPLKDTREMTKSLSKLDEEAEAMLDLHEEETDRLADRSRSSIGSSIPESIPEESTTPGSHIPSPDRPSRVNLTHEVKYERNYRRHSLQVGAEDIHVPAHVLHEVTDCQRKPMAISPELMEEYRGITREELIKLVHTQKNALYSKDMYIRDLESYIDNLLVRVMESQPRILQNPFSSKVNTDVTLVMTPTSQSVVKTAPSQRKSNNPFKLRT